MNNAQHAQDLFANSLSQADIATLRAALDDGRLSSTALVCCFLNRIARYDRHGLRLNAVPVLNPALFDEARTADERRRRGASRGPLDGIPYLAKASYAVRGLEITSGSPAFEHLVAQRDAFVIGALREAGAVLIGLTNMPPMAAGGMQRGLYGRAESPYNPAFLTAAFASGSSNGSGSGLAAGFAVFALAEETWSSGRAPASNNALVAYTPSRGLISMRGNWPLIPTMDVVVPYARNVADLFEVLNVVVADDEETRGDFWRVQSAVPLPRASAVRPADYRTLADRDALRGKRIGVPRMYINKDVAAARPIATRASIIALWERAAEALRTAGATLEEVDFPLVSNYDRDRPGAASMVERGLIPAEFAQAEGWDLITFAWHDYLVANGDPKLASLGDVVGSLIIPPLPGAERDRYEGLPSFAEYPLRARQGVTAPDDIPHLAAGLRGLEATRKRDLEDWLEARGLDFLVFPAVADIAPADADYNPRSADIAWRNGIWVANGNQVIRHCGVPTVTVAMGVMDDTGMPVGLTFAGCAYDDNALLSAAYAFEVARQRAAPARLPPLDDDRLPLQVMSSRAGVAPTLAFDATLSAVDDGQVTIVVRGTAHSNAALANVAVYVNGEAIAVQRDGENFTATVALPYTTHYHLHSRWRGPYGSIVLVRVDDAAGGCSADYRVVGGVG